MDYGTLRKAAWMFSNAAYETTSGNWIFSPEEVGGFEPDALDEALRYVGGGFLLDVETYDGCVDLTLSTHYACDEETEASRADGWRDAWDTAAACWLFGKSVANGVAEVPGWALGMTCPGFCYEPGGSMLRVFGELFGDYAKTEASGGEFRVRTKGEPWA